MKLTDPSYKTARKSVRWKLGAVISGALVLAIAGCAGPAPTDDGAEVPEFAAGTTMAKLADAGSINVGVKFDAPGYSEKTLDGNYEGMDIDIAKMVAKALGIDESKIQWTETVSVNREPFLQQGKVDMVAASYAIEENRQKVVTFAGPYVTTSQVLLVAKGNPLDIETWDDVAGKSVCGISASSELADVEENAPTANRVGFDTDAKCVLALKNGQVDAVVGSIGSMGGYVKQDNKSVELSPLVYGAQPIGIGVAKGDVEFCEFIDDVMEKAWEDGTFQDAWNATLKHSLGQDPQKPEFIDCK